MPALNVCTIVTKNYIAYARSMVASFLQHHPEGRAFVLIVDDYEGFIEPSKEPFTIISTDDFNIGDIEHWRFKFNPVEMCMVFKPRMLRYVLETFDVHLLCHLDNDIRVYGRFNELVDMLDEHQMVFTPHLLSPKADTEQVGMMRGHFNTGIVGVRNTAIVRNEILPWWAERACGLPVVIHRREEFRDQAWSDLIPSLFDDIGVLRDVGYNVAPWNLANRPMTQEGSSWQVHSQPLKFFHFSRVRVAGEEAAHSTVQDDSVISDAVKALFADYQQQLEAHGLEETKLWPYSYGAFSDGTPIPSLARSLFRKQTGASQRWSNPFDVGSSSSFVDWLNQPDDTLGKPRPILTRIAAEAYRQDGRISDIYPYIGGKHRLYYVLWFLSKGKANYKLANVFTQPVAESIPWLRHTIYKLRLSIGAFLRRLGIMAYIKRLLGRT